MSKAIQAAGMTMTGLLAGNELSTLIGLHPALRALPLDIQVEAERALTARLGRIMPFFMTGTVLATAATDADGRGARGELLRHTALAASALMLGITLFGNVPLNARTTSYDSADGPQAWAQIRGQWERLHRVRVLLDLIAFAALTAAVLTDE